MNEDQWKAEWETEQRIERESLHGPEPVEEPEWCSLCGKYGHDSLDCTWDDHNDEGDENA